MCGALSFRYLARSIALICLLVAGLQSQTLAQEQALSRGINHHYEDADYMRWRPIFESPRREIYARRTDIVAALHLRPGMTVADIGAGTGFFSLLFAREVGLQGLVYAVDISPNFVENTVRRAKDQGLPNVRGILSTPRTVSLPAGSIEVAFVCDTYHHFEYPQDMLRSIHAALRPNGSLFVIDYRKIPGLSSGWVMNHVRANQREVIAEIEAEGFRLEEEFALLPANYFLRFKKL